MEKLLNNVLYIHIVLRMPQDFLIFPSWPNTSTFHCNEALTVQTQHLYNGFPLHYT